MTRSWSAALFLVLVGWSAASASAATFTALGPEFYVRQTGAPTTVITNFAVANPSAQYTIQIYNGGLVDGDFDRVSNSIIKINGLALVNSSEFNQNVAYLEKPIPLLANNALSVELHGEPGGGIAILIVGVDADQPTITATVTPQPNAAGWNKTNVIVTFTCQDATSGIATCPGPTTVTTEGAGQVVSGTATDRAGLSATTSVTINLDKTAPTITATPSPAPNGNGWNRTPVVIGYSCQDVVSGVPACPPSTTVTAAGANQPISATAEDRAGNTASVTTTLSIDATPPSIAVQASPAPNAAGWNNSDVTVTFTGADGLSGLVGTTSPVTVTSEGAGQVVQGTATDRAGNVATTSATVNLDKTPPTLTLTSPSGTITGNPAPPIQLTYTDATSGAVTGSLGVSVDGAPLSGCSFGQSTGTCVPPNLAAGQHVSSAQVTDLAGNAVTASGSFSIVLATPIDIQITQPATGLLTHATSLQVSGTVSPLADVVIVNGITATRQGGSFTASGVPLVEGTNIVTAVATNAAGDAGTSSITVVRDTSPPTVVIESPAAGQVVNTESVIVVGLVNDVVTGTVTSQDCQVTLSGRAGTATATVSNRTFMVENFPLVPGPNSITAVATDTAGNVSVPFQMNIVRVESAGQTLRTVGGDRQTGVVGTELALPLSVALRSPSGLPLAGRQVTFRVTRGDGNVRVGAASGRSLTATTDAGGLALVFFRLGSRSGLGLHRVTASAAGFPAGAEFTATATAASADGIEVYDFDTQRGVAGHPLPEPFTVFVHDHEGNPVTGTPVTFQVTAGGGNIEGAADTTVATDQDGRARIRLTLGPTPGINNNRVDATLPGNPSAAAVFIASGLAIGSRAETRVSGIVLDNSNLPVPGVTMRILGSGLSTTTDAQGRFAIPGAPVATVTLEADGTTAARPGVWPMLHFELTTISGVDNTIGMPLFLLPIDTASGGMVGGPQDVTLTMADVPGLSLTVFANSVTCLDGSHQCLVSISQVHNDKVPMPPLEGAAPALIWTVQPPGTRFDPPARITYPNVNGLSPGAVTEVLSFDHDLGQYVSVGTATVSEDGALITSDHGGGIAHAGWGYPRVPPIQPSGFVGCDDGNICNGQEVRAGRFGCITLPSSVPPLCTPCTPAGRVCDGVRSCSLGREIVDKIADRLTIPYTKTDTPPKGAAGICTAGDVYAIGPLTTTCDAVDMVGSQLTEKITRDDQVSNCPFGIQVAPAPIPVGAHGAINTTDTYAIRAPIFGPDFSLDCSERWTQELSINGQLVQRARIDQQFTMRGSTCSNTVIRTPLPIP